jgi:hypothetical protein
VTCSSDVGQTIVFCGLSLTALGRRNFMKRRTNCPVVVGVSLAFSTLPAPLKRRCTSFSLCLALVWKYNLDRRSFLRPAWPL